MVGGSLFIRSRGLSISSRTTSNLNCYLIRRAWELEGDYRGWGGGGGVGEEGKRLL